jgi:hypothetical protein
MNRADRRRQANDFARTDAQDMRLSHHEAGHAVLAWRYGFPIVRAEMLCEGPDPTTGKKIVGSCVTLGAYEPKGDDAPRRVLQLLAGEAAERRAGFFFGPAIVDRAEVKTMLVPAVDLRDFWRRWMAEADRVVGELWDIIVAVAAELRSRRVLTGDEITAIAQRAWDSRRAGEGSLSENL